MNTDDPLLAEAARLTGVNDPAALVRRGLEELIRRESARRLARLAGSDTSARPSRRRRPTRLIARQLRRRK